MMPMIEGRRGASFWIAAILFGAIFPTLVAWFIVSPLKHQPIAGGWKPHTMMIGPIVNAAWGFGTALIYRVFIPVTGRRADSLTLLSRHEARGHHRHGRDLAARQ
jgi:hypothetical protein